MVLLPLGIQTRCLRGTVADRGCARRYCQVFAQMESDVLQDLYFTDISLDQHLEELELGDGSSEDTSGIDVSNCTTDEQKRAVKAKVKANLELHMKLIQEYALQVVRNQKQYNVTFSGRKCLVTDAANDMIACFRFSTPVAGILGATDLLDFVLAAIDIIVWRPGGKGHCGTTGCPSPLEVKDFRSRYAFSAKGRLQLVYQRLVCKAGRGGCVKVSSSCNAIPAVTHCNTL